MPESTLVLSAKDAIQRHIQWRITLQLAIALQEPLSAGHLDQILHFRQCAIGRWLDSEATLAMQADPAYADLVNKHIDFHKEMGRVANLIAACDFREAGRSIDPRSSFGRSSKALANAMMAFDQITPMAVPV